MNWKPTSDTEVSMLQDDELFDIDHKAVMTPLFLKEILQVLENGKIAEGFHLKCAVADRKNLTEPFVCEITFILLDQVIHTDNFSNPRVAEHSLLDGHYHLYMLGKVFDVLIPSKNDVKSIDKRLHIREKRETSAGVQYTCVVHDPGNTERAAHPYIFTMEVATVARVQGIKRYPHHHMRRMPDCNDARIHDIHIDVVKVGKNKRGELSYIVQCEADHRIPLCEFAMMLYPDGTIQVQQAPAYDPMLERTDRERMPE